MAAVSTSTDGRVLEVLVLIIGRGSKFLPIQTAENSVAVLAEQRAWLQRIVSAVLDAARFPIAPGLAGSRWIEKKRVEGRDTYDRLSLLLLFNSRCIRPSSASGYSYC